MSTRAGLLIALAGALAFPAACRSQIVFPTQAFETLDVEMLSSNNKVTLYFGDPQQLVFMKYRPDRLRPRVEYTSQAAALLRIRDLCLVQYEPSREGDPPVEPPKKNPNESQTWEVRLSPSGPTSFVLYCDHGENTFDFTDFQVQRVEIHAEGSKVDVGFSGQNPIALDAFIANVPQGSLRFEEMLNARAKEMVLRVPESACALELTGDEFEGETAVTFDGVPSSMQLVVSRKIGLRVTGPAEIGALFQDARMAQSGADWVSRDFDTAKCRARLVFSEAIPGLTVSWH